MVNAQRYFLQCILKCINPTLPQATYGKKRSAQSALSPGTKRMVRGKPGFNFSSRKGIKTPFWTKIKSSCLKCWAADSERIWMRTSWTSGCTWKLSPKDGHWMLTIDIYIYVYHWYHWYPQNMCMYIYIYILVCVCLDILIFMYIMYIYDDIWWPLCSPQTNGQKLDVKLFHVHPFPTSIIRPKKRHRSPRHRSSGTEAITASRASFRVQT